MKSFSLHNTSGSVAKRGRALPFMLLFLTAAVIAVATFVEDVRGTAFIHAHVYDAWWFKLLWVAVAVVSVVLLVRGRIWKKIPMLLLHLGFGVIFAGASVTAFTGHKGMLHLRRGQLLGEYVDERSGTAHLPFVVRLDSFRIEYYPGTETPADYVSHISCLHSAGDVFARPSVSMNRVFSVQGFRLYQSSYDEDLLGSWLSVNYDPWGMAVTYVGFCLLGLGCVFVLCAPGGGFRRLLKHPLMRKGGLFVVTLSFGCHMQARTPLPVVTRNRTDSLAYEQVVWRGRVAPFNTLARDFVKKIYGHPTLRGITPEQVVTGWMLYPEDWNRAPVILVKDYGLRDALGIRGKYASLADFFDGKRYKLQTLWGVHSQAGRDKTARAIQETDEKVALILMLRQGTLVHPVPPGAPRLPPSKIAAEIWYNRIPFGEILFMVNLAAGLVAFGLLMFRTLVSRKETPQSRRAWSAFLWIVTLFHAAGYALRGYVRGNFPLTDGYETMQFVALSVLLTACLLGRRFPFTRPFGLLLSGFILLTAFLCDMNPQITPLMPVLASPWLAWHVSLIMIAYGFFAFTCLNGMLALCLLGRRASALSLTRREQVCQLTLLSRFLLYPATFCLGVGIVLGSVWAGRAWGSYWSWDPKEAWALVAFIVYGISFHRKSLPFFRKPWIFHAYMVFAFAVVLMTYFGVNYLLGGMHSYAG